MACTKGWHVTLNIISTLQFLLTASSAIYNLVQLVDNKDFLTFSFEFDLNSQNYKLGIIVQCVVIAAFCFFAAIHEIASICNTTLFPFMEKDMGRAAVHIILAGLSLGFCGGYGLIIECIQVFVALLCFCTSTSEAWNPIDIESGSGGEDTFS